VTFVVWIFAHKTKQKNPTNIAIDQRTERETIALDHRTERDSAPEINHEHDAALESTENEHDNEHNAALGITERTERDPAQNKNDNTPRSHADFLRDLAQLSDDDYGFFRDESFTLTPDQFWDFHDAYNAGEFPAKIGRYEYDGTTLYFKNITIVHGGFTSTAGTEMYQQCLSLHDHPAVG